MGPDSRSGGPREFLSGVSGNVESWGVLEKNWRVESVEDCVVGSCGRHGCGWGSRMAGQQSWLICALVVQED